MSDYKIIATPANYDEDAYLRYNPDVAIDVRSGAWKSGRQHFDRWGHKEGRAIGYDFSGYASDQGLSTPIPSADLIHLVNGHYDPRAFDISRKATVQAILKLLESVGADPKALTSILDFGCGCGRVLAGWEHDLPRGAALHGCDINADLIGFVNENIPFAQAIVSPYYPPLPYEDEQFDLVYAGSVYTHLTLPALQQWTGEMTRIIKPGGYAIISFHGSYYAPELKRISAEGSRKLAERGHYVHLHVAKDATWEGSNHYATFLSPDFMRRLFAGFRTAAIYPGISHGPNPFASYQDIAIFQRTAD